MPEEISQFLCYCLAKKGNSETVANTPMDHDHLETVRTFFISHQPEGLVETSPKMLIVLM